MTWTEYENSPLAVAEVSLDGSFLRANHTFLHLLGYSEPELTQLRVRDVTHPEDRPQSVFIVDRSLRHYEEAVEVIKRYLHKNGTVVWGLLRTTLKRDSTGEPTHFLSFVVDVSQRMRQETLPRALGRRLQQIQEQERQRVAQELHDELGQVLTALKLEINWLQSQVPPGAEARAARLSTLVDEVMGSVRRLWLGLRPSILDDLGLEAAIDWLLQEVCARAKMEWDFRKPRHRVVLDSDAKIALFRVCQEALTNIVRHSKATQVRITLSAVSLSRARPKGGQPHPPGQRIHLRISDNGIGLDPTAPPRRDAMGLLGIRDRVGVLGGSVMVKRGVGGGTVIQVTLPSPIGVENGRQVPPFWE